MPFAGLDNMYKCKKLTAQGAHAKLAVRKPSHVTCALQAQPPGPRQVRRGNEDRAKEQLFKTSGQTFT